MPFEMLMHLVSLWAIRDCCELFCLEWWFLAVVLFSQCLLWIKTSRMCLTVRWPKLHDNLISQKLLVENYTFFQVLCNYAEQDFMM